MNSEFDNLNNPGAGSRRSSSKTVCAVCGLAPVLNDGAAWQLNQRPLSPTGFHSQSVVSMSNARIDLWDQYFKNTPKKKLPCWWQISLWPCRVRKTARFDGAWKLPFLPDTQPFRVDESVWSRIELLCKMTSDAGIALIIHRPTGAPRKAPPTDWWTSVAAERLSSWNHIVLLGSWGGDLEKSRYAHRLSIGSFPETATPQQVWTSAASERRITLVQREEPPNQRFGLPSAIDGLVHFSKGLGFEWIGVRELPDAVETFGPGSIQAFANHRYRLLLLCRALRSNGIALRSPEGCWSGGWYDAQTGDLLLNLPGREVKRSQPARMPTVRAVFSVGFLEMKT